MSYYGTVTNYHYLDGRPINEEFRASLISLRDAETRAASRYYTTGNVMPKTKKTRKTKRSPLGFEYRQSKRYARQQARWRKAHPKAA